MASKIVPSSFRALARCGRREFFPQKSLTSVFAQSRRVIPPQATKSSLSAPATTIRLAHSIPRPSPSASNNQKSATADSIETNTNIAPSYELTFTCIPCGTRSAHNVSKQGYHYGSVLITCPSCRNRHVISDHLGIFGKDKVTVEDILKNKGVLVKRGTLGEDGDLEFWEDGSTTSRSERQGEGDGQDPKPKPKPKASTNGEANTDAPGSTFGQA